MESEERPVTSPIEQKTAEEQSLQHDNREGGKNTDTSVPDLLQAAEKSEKSTEKDLVNTQTTAPKNSDPKISRRRPGRGIYI